MGLIISGGVDAMLSTDCYMGEEDVGVVICDERDGIGWWLGATGDAEVEVGCHVLMS